MKTIIGAFLFVFSLRAMANPVYEVEKGYFNPLAADTQLCVDFYWVERPILPLVNHIFIGVVVAASDEAPPILELYGASKGPSDIKVFQDDFADLQASTKTGKLSYLGQRCGPEAFSALQTAVKISRQWQERLSHNLYFYPRMVLTPLFGRVCKNAAAEVAQALGFR